MNGLQTLPMSPTGQTEFDAYRFRGIVLDDLDEDDVLAAGDYPLPPPAPGSRLPMPLEPADRRRLELHAALTTAGIAPLPGDLAAIEALCALDDSTHIALQRWIRRAS